MIGYFFSFVLAAFLMVGFGGGTTSAELLDTLDLDVSQEDVRILGHNSGDRSGHAVASGDINGDGYDDLIIGAWGANPPGGEGAGETYVIYGSRDLPDTVDLAKGEEDVRILGDDDGDLSGFAVASGDINGDGYDDLIIGAWAANRPGGESAGETYVIYGSRDLPDTVDLTKGEEDVRILGDDGYDDSGHAVASGDINGDGYDDLIIGAWAADQPGGGNAGETYIIYGSRDLPDTVDLSGSEEDVRVLGDDGGDLSGFAVASGDINGDGYDDLVIGAPWADPPAGLTAGETYVIYGSRDLPDTVDVAGGAEVVRLLGDNAGDQSGHAVACGDINGDGYDDLIIGAWAANPPGGMSGGEAYVIYGSRNLPDTVDFDRGEEDIRMKGDDAYDRSGFAVASGDINGDGYDDLVVGAPEADPLNGETYVVYGSGGDLPDTVDFDRGEEDIRIRGDDAYDRSGFAVACGDINGDGCDDLIIGANEADTPGGSNAGETYIVYGRPIFVATFELLQNYPNPFHSSTSIQYAVISDRTPPHITLKIMNLQGQEVRTLVDEAKKAGYHEVTWDGKDRFGNEVESGVYFYHLVTRDFTATRRMVLMK